MSRALVAVVLSVYGLLIVSLLWSHIASTNVWNVLAQKDSEARNLPRTQAVRQLIVHSRATSEEWYQRSRVAQEAFDRTAGRVASKCPTVDKWIQEVPCTPNLTQHSVLVTDHFQQYNDSFLVPHYDDLGAWKVSTTSSVWEVEVDPSHEGDLQCGRKWLEFSRAFQPIGSLPGTLLEAIQRRSDQIGIKARLQDIAFQEYLITVLTRQAAWFEGIDVPPLVIAQAIAGGKWTATSAVPKFDRSIVESFATGLRYAFRQLVPRPIHEWTFVDFNRLHAAVCRTEFHAGDPTMEGSLPGDLLGRTRFGRHNIAYGLTSPNALGFEVPYLTRVLEHWLHRTVADGCQSRVTVAFDLFIYFYHIHPYMDCNTRVAQILMNALLIYLDIPPIQLLLYLDRVQLRQLQNQAVKGTRSPLFELLANQILQSSEIILLYDVKASR